MNRETEPAFYRPKERRLVNLSNEELQALFDIRSSKIKLDPEGFWDCNKIVYWNTMIPRFMDLYEVMLEIQSRYPKDEICEEYSEKGGYFNRLLPLNEPEYIKLASK